MDLPSGAWQARLSCSCAWSARLRSADAQEYPGEQRNPTESCVHGPDGVIGIGRQFNRELKRVVLDRARVARNGAIDAPADPADLRVDQRLDRDAIVGEVAPADHQLLWLSACDAQNIEAQVDP